MVVGCTRSDEMLKPVPYRYETRLRADFDVKLACSLNRKWSADVLLDALYLQCAVRGLQSDAVAIVDPRLVTLVCEGHSVNFAQNAHLLKSQLHAPLALIPLHSDDHWSLLAYFHAWGLWISIDSAAPMHRQHVLRTLQRLQKLGVLQQVEKEQLELRETTQTKEECGLCTTQAAVCVLEAHGTTAVETSEALDTVLQHCGTTKQFAQLLLQQASELTSGVCEQT